MTLQALVHSAAFAAVLGFASPGDDGARELESVSDQELIELAASCGDVGEELLDETRCRVREGVDFGRLDWTRVMDHVEIFSCRRLWPETVDVVVQASLPYWMHLALGRVGLRVTPKGSTLPDFKRSALSLHGHWESGLWRLGRFAGGEHRVVASVNVLRGPRGAKDLGAVVWSGERSIALRVVPPEVALSPVEGSYFDDFIRSELQISVGSDGGCYVDLRRSGSAMPELAGVGLSLVVELVSAGSRSKWSIRLSIRSTQSDLATSGP